MYPSRAKPKPGPATRSTAAPKPATGPKPPSSSASRSTQPSKMPVGDPDAGLILRIFSKAGKISPHLRTLQD